ncbi:MAG TPA: caspase family protein [Bryobacteraceae bacterium]|nr:caspase family protein [Bryobacteraceae bacterium]
MPRLAVALLFVLTLGAQTARDLKLERVAPPLPDKKARWAIVVGVSSYKYAPPAAQLRYAHRDAEEFAKLLRSTEGGAFPSDHVRVLTDGTATVGAIRAALHNWLPKSAGPNDIVYIFFAGHAVVAERNETYFVANDSDPQNLHATGVSFREVNDTLTNKLRAATVVLFADACHAGGIGWTSDPSQPSTAQPSLEALGARDRAVIKLLASRPSERSFEDERWGGGHGVFTYSVLTALRGAAEREKDGFVRVSELINYVSRVVPEQTDSKQNPRVAGNFEGSLPMASLPAELRKEEPAAASALVLGKPATAVYFDNEYRGAIRQSGELMINSVAGAHALSLDSPGQGTFDQPLTLRPGQNIFDMQKAPEFALFRLQSALRSGTVLGPNGALEIYKTERFPSSQVAAAEAMIVSALEDIGQECVSDYVQSTINTLKRSMFLQAVQAYNTLKSFRPADTSIEAKSLFCQARAQIASGEFSQAVETLNRSLTVDPQFACSYNALGVALSRLDRAKEARSAFETAGKLTPAWALPPLQIAQQLIAANDLSGAVPYLEQAARLNPRAIGIHWSLARLYRLLGRGQDFVQLANTTIAIDPNYAPIYSELGQYYEAAREFAKAAQAYDSYLLLAPNFVDSADIRKRAQRSRVALEPRAAPTLRRDGDKKR